MGLRKDSASEPGLDIDECRDGGVHSCPCPHHFGLQHLLPIGGRRIRSPALHSWGSAGGDTEDEGTLSHIISLQSDPARPREGEKLRKDLGFRPPENK